MPAHHVFDDPIRQAVGLEQIEHLLPEQGLQVGGAGLIGLLKSPLSIEAVVRGDDVQVRIKVLEVAERLDRYHAAGHGIVIKDGVLQVLAQDLPGAF